MRKRERTREIRSEVRKEYKHLLCPTVPSPPPKKIDVCTPLQCMINILPMNGGTYLHSRCTFHQRRYSSTYKNELRNTNYKNELKTIVQIINTCANFVFCCCCLCSSGGYDELCIHQLLLLPPILFISVSNLRHEMLPFLPFLK